jgi:hypothetical protein
MRYVNTRGRSLCLFNCARASWLLYRFSSADKGIIHPNHYLIWNYDCSLMLLSKLMKRWPHGAFVQICSHQFVPQLFASPLYCQGNDRIDTSSEYAECMVRKNVNDNSRKSNEKRKEYFRRTMREVMEFKSNWLFFIYRSYVHTIYIAILLEHILGDQEWPVNPFSLSRRQLKIVQIIHMNFLHLFKILLYLLLRKKNSRTSYWKLLTWFLDFVEHFPIFIRSSEISST